MYWIEQNNDFHKTTTLNSGWNLPNLGIIKTPHLVKPKTAQTSKGCLVQIENSITRDAEQS